MEYHVSAFSACVYNYLG